MLSQFFDPLSTFHSTCTRTRYLAAEEQAALIPRFDSVITGPNCAGKSTYMRSVAVVTILAQMGCFVPAVEAYIPVRDRICTRFGTSDAMEENASTFGVEMTETAFILETCTSKSLVLVDELGRGTTNEEGIAIAFAISEELIQRRAYTCFATHYHDLSSLARMYPRCRCYHLSATVGEVRWLREDHITLSCSLTKCNVLA